MSNSYDIAIVIPSCDAYSDLWNVFFELFKKNYPDCPFKIYLITNHKKPVFDGVEVLPVGEDISWSDNLLKGLTMVQESRVILWVDDLLLVKKVETKYLNKVIEAAIENNVNYICLNANPKPNKKINDFLGLVNPGILYRVSAVLSLWKKETLTSILQKGESAWQFEIEGSVRSDSHPFFTSTYRRVFCVLNSVIKGKWRRFALYRIKSFGIVVQDSPRKVFSLFEEFVFGLKQIRSFVFDFFPPQHRRFIRSIFKK